MRVGLVGSEMCIRDSPQSPPVHVTDTDSLFMKSTCNFHVIGINSDTRSIHPCRRPTDRHEIMQAVHLLFGNGRGEVQHCFTKCSSARFSLTLARFPTPQHPRDPGFMKPRQTQTPVHAGSSFISSPLAMAEEKSSIASRSAVQSGSSRHLHDPRFM